MNFIDQMNKYVLYISIILNGILLMTVVGVLPFLLYLSVITNIVFVWYTSKCLLRISDVEEDMMQLMEKNENFLVVLENLHALEMYYGDENLQNLIDNSRELINDFIDIQEKYFDVEVTMEEDDEEDYQAEEGE